MGSEGRFGLRLGFKLGFGVFRQGVLVKTLVGTESGKPFHVIKIAEDIIYH